MRAANRGFLSCLTIASIASVLTDRPRLWTTSVIGGFFLFGFELGDVFSRVLFPGVHAAGAADVESLAFELDCGSPEAASDDAFGSLIRRAEAALNRNADAGEKSSALFKEPDVGVVVDHLQLEGLRLLGLGVHAAEDIGVFLKFALKGYLCTVGLTLGDKEIVLFGGIVGQEPLFEIEAAFPKLGGQADVVIGKVPIPFDGVVPSGRLALNANAHSSHTVPFADELVEVVELRSCDVHFLFAEFGK